MEEKEFRPLPDQAILTALIVVDYYARLYPGMMAIEQGREEAFIKVYNCLLDECIERGIMEY